MSRRKIFDRRSILKIAFSAGLAPFSNLGFSQAAWPKAKPIKIIVPFPPGNTIDTIARLIQGKISEVLDQSVIVDNVGGAYGRIGMAAIARANPDGYTLGAVQGGPMIVQPHTVKGLPYNTITDFAPVAVSAWNYNALAGSNTAPFKTLQQMVAWAKANPNKLTVGSTGEGGFSHLWFEDFRRQLGISYTHVPYKGTSGLATDLGAGEIMAAVDGISGLAPFVKGGSIRLLATTNVSPPAEWPGVPTLNEIIPGFVVNGWFGFVFPAKTPVEIINRMNQAINSAIQSPGASEKLASYGLLGIAQSPEYFDALNKKDYQRYGDLVKAIGLVPQ
jgi:tripartite-type tricarboxylate transporter receptor subunit TctC